MTSYNRDDIYEVSTATRNSVSTVASVKRATHPAVDDANNWYVAGLGDKEETADPGTPDGADGYKWGKLYKNGTELTGLKPDPSLSLQTRRLLCERSIAPTETGGASYCDIEARNPENYWRLRYPQAVAVDGGGTVAYVMDRGREYLGQWLGYELYRVDLATMYVTPLPVAWGSLKVDVGSSSANLVLLANNTLVIAAGGGGLVYDIGLQRATRVETGSGQGNYWGITTNAPRDASIAVDPSQSQLFSGRPGNVTDGCSAYLARFKIPSGEFEWLTDQSRGGHDDGNPGTLCHLLGSAVTAQGAPPSSYWIYLVDADQTSSNGKIRKLEVARPSKQDIINAHAPDNLGNTAEWLQFAGDPVNVANGNMVSNATDVTFSPEVYGLNFERVYNSLDKNQGPFGVGWTTNFSVRVNAVTNSVPVYDVTMLMADGRRAVFTRTGPGTWSAPRGVFGTLSYNTSTYRLELLYATGEKWVFNQNGSLAQKIGPDGQTVTLSYANASFPYRFTKAESSTGRRLEFGWTDASGGRITSVTAKTSIAGQTDDRVVRYTYADSTDSPACSFCVWRGPGGDGTEGRDRYTTDGQGRVIEQWTSTGRTGTGNPYTFAENQLLGASYDSYGRVSTQTLYHGNASTAETVSLDYKTADSVRVPGGVDTEVTWSSPAVGSETVVYTVDVDSRIRLITDPFTKEVKKNWNSSGRPTSLTDRSGAESGYQYDQYGRLLQRAVPDPGTGKVPTSDGSTSPCDRNSDGSFPAPDIGGCVGYKFTLETYTYMADAPGDPRVETFTNAAGDVTRYTYDAGVLVPKSVTVGYGSASPLTTTYTIVNNRVTDATDADGVRTCSDYNVSTGRLDSVRTACGTPSEAATSYTYTGLGQVETVRAPAQQPSGPVTRYTYYGTGQVKDVTDPLGNMTSYEYDLEGRRTKTTYPGGAYAAAGVTYGNASSDCGSAGAGCRIETDDQPYDGATRRVTKRYFDVVGNLREVRAAAGTSDEAVTTYTYGPMRRLLSSEDPTGVKTFYDYDENGNVRTVVNGSSLADTAGAVTETVFDKLGRVIQTTKPSVSSTSSVRPVTANVYDKLGRVIQTADGDAADGFLPGSEGTCVRNADGTFPVPMTGGCTSKDFVLRTTSYLANGLTDKTAVYRSDAGHGAGTEAWVKQFYTPGGRARCTVTRVQDGGWATEKRVVDGVDYDVAGRAVKRRRQLAAVVAPPGLTPCDDSPTDTAKWAISATGYNPDGTTAWQQTPVQYAYTQANSGADPALYRTSL
ncbi:MAG: RHS repeat protein, partial [Actinobacteria bacterium]|nr:RHS repeat protein [Actinomycetota bacterium]